jgi:hypothetical protein
VPNTLAGDSTDEVGVLPPPPPPQDARTRAQDASPTKKGCFMINPPHDILGIISHLRFRIMWSFGPTVNTSCFDL